MKRVALYAGAAVVGGLVLYVIIKKRPGESLASGAGRAVVGAVNDVAVGGVKGIAQIFGIPDTNDTQCQRDRAAGRTYEASFSCPASEFIGHVFGSTRASESVQNDARQIDRIMERQAKSGGYLGGVYDHATGEQIGAYDEMGNRIY